MNTFKCLTLEKADGVAFVSLLDEKLADPVRVEQLGREMLALADLQPPLIVMSFKGVNEAHAIQAGREVRVMIDADKVDDDDQQRQHRRHYLQPPRERQVSRRAAVERGRVQAQL
jgi:hypothetical protein